MTTAVEVERAYWGNVDPADTREHICGDTDPAYGLDRVLAVTGGADRVIDLGCGPGRLTIPVALADPEATVIGVDISGVAVDLAEQRARVAGAAARFVVGDGRTIDLASGSCDVAYSMLLFQHIPDAAVRGYLAELGRVLRPGGRLLFQFVEGDYRCAFDQRRTLREVEQWLAAAGFSSWSVDRDAEYVEWLWVGGTR